MYYGFKKSDGRCVWSIDMLPNAQDGVVMLESDVEYDITQICIDPEATEFKITAVIKSDEETLIENINKRDGLMAVAKDKIDVLNDVVEFANSEESEALLAEWRTYRAALYNMKFENVAGIVWPATPSDY